MDGPMMYTPQVWSSTAEVDRLGPEWDDLFTRATRASVYQSRVWCSAWLAGRAGLSPPVIYGVRRGNRLVALLPLVRAGPCGVAVPIGTGESAYLGLLLDDKEPSALEAMSATLREHEICFYSYDLLSTDQPTQALLDSLSQSGWSISRRRRNPVFQVELPESYDKYLAAHKSSRSQQMLRRKERMLEKAYHVDVLRFDGDEITGDLLDRCSAVQRESWMVRRGADVLSQASTIEMIRAMGAAGLAGVWMLSLDGHDAAFVACWKAHGTLYYQYPSFSLHYPPRLSIGNYLISRLLQDIIADGARLLDFGHGDAEYKRFWGTVERRVDRVIAGRGPIGLVTAKAMPLAWDCWTSRSIRRVRAVMKRLRPC